MDALFMAAAIYLLRQHNKVRVNPRIELKSHHFETPSIQSVQAKPTCDSDFDAIIIGGGASGLAAAFGLKDKKVLVLEKSSVFGGNARFEEKHGLKYPTAGVCFQKPRQGGPMDNLLKALGLQDKYKDTGPDTIVFFDTNLLMKSIGEVTMAILKHPAELLKLSVWRSTLTLIINWVIGKPFVVSPKSIGDPIFDDLYQFLERFSVASGNFPEMPWQEETGMSREYMELLDRITLKSYLFEPEKHQSLPEAIRPEKKYGKLVESAVETTLRVECLSLDNVSAYVGIHFLIGYLKGTLVTLPGGNGFISHSLQEYLGKQDNVTLLNQATVTRIEAKEKTTVTFKVNETLKSVTAPHIIWAAPKHALADLIPTIPEKQQKAISAIAHHDYCVGSVYLKKSVLASYFGGYVIEPFIRNNPLEWVKTGVCLVPQWMDDSYRQDTGVLSLLKPIGHKEDQGKLEKATFDELQKQTYLEVAKLLSAKGIDDSVIEDIKLWPWKKSLVVATVGQQADDVFSKASEAVHLSDSATLFFANQDSVGIGNIESAIHAGFHAADQLLGSPVIRNTPESTLT